MQLTYHVVDAFTDAVFSGNPAAVLVLREPLPDTLMQAIAAENNLAETAFVVAANRADSRAPDAADGYPLRWFTPTVEVPLCGHATLAAAFVLDRLGYPAPFRFDTLSGPLGASLAEGRIVLDFPARRRLTGAAPPAGLAEALGGVPDEVHQALDWLCVFRSPDVVASLRPDFRKVASLPGGAAIVTAAGGEAGADITSRYFAPGWGIDEDPVTGSAHTQLAPFWSARLGRDELVCRQASARGGTLWCTMAGERVRIAGHAVLYAEGRISVPAG